MELDITHLSNNAPVQDYRNTGRNAERKAAQESQEAAQNAAAEARKRSAQQQQSAEQYIKEIVDYTRFFNKRLRFTINRELEQVVVKVIDRETDKVIKEIPPEVLQRLHVRIREAIGLLFDESI